MKWGIPEGSHFGLATLVTFHRLGISLSGALSGMRLPILQRAVVFAWFVGSVTAGCGLQITLRRHKGELTSIKTPVLLNLGSIELTLSINGSQFQEEEGSVLLSRGMV